MNSQYGYRVLFFIIMMFTAAHAVAENGSLPPTSVLPESIPNTDGYGLQSKLPAPSRELNDKYFKQGRISCQSDCITPTGKLLGIADNVKAFSNCSSKCIQSEYSFLNLKNKDISIHEADPKNKELHYVGLIYQCVEYARRWWMKNEGITFGDVNGAYEIMYLKDVENIYSKTSSPLARSINGTAKRAPQRGDLLIYYPNKEDPKWRYGHVAVVIDVDLENGSVALAEQNYNNKVWENPEKFARKISLFEIGGRYRLLDVNMASNKNTNGGLISGWVYPATKK